MSISSSEPIQVRQDNVPADSRLAVVRRLYSYGVTLVSYLVMLAGLDALIRILDQSWFSAAQPALHSVNVGVFYRDALASNGGLLLIAVPLFLFHWNYAQGWARRSSDEAGAGMRKFFLYVALISVLIYGLTAFHEVMSGFGLLALGAPLSEESIWYGGWFHAALVIVLSAGLGRYWVFTLQRDGDYGQEEGMAGFWRRLYLTGAGLASLVLIVLGGAQILQSIWQIFTGLLAFTAGQLWPRLPIAEGFSLLLIGGYLLRLNWRAWQAICVAHPEERSRGLRRFFLYGAVLIGALATLIPTAGLLEEGLLMLFGLGRGDRWALLDGLGRPVALIPLGFAVWSWYWRYLRSEEASAPATHEAATIRRLYYYAVAATGLALLWFGAVALVQTGLDWLLVTQRTATSTFMLENLAQGLSLIIVGAPIWAFHWRAVEQVARRTDNEGLAERASGPRRVYLYGVALVGALLILAFLAQVAYRGFLLALGDPDNAFFSPQAAGDLARSAIAAILWIVHILAIRRDGQMGASLPRTTELSVGETEANRTSYAPVDLSPDPAARRAALDIRIRRLEEELAQARAELAALPPEEASSRNR